MSKKKTDKKEKVTKETELMDEASADDAQVSDGAEDVAEQCEEECCATKAERERDEYLSLLQRERADFENYKRRNASIVAATFADAQMETATKFLPVLDNLERAIAAAEEESALKEGVQMVYNQTLDILKGMGIAEIPAEGASFDPMLHNAVMQVEAEEGEESGMIREVLQKGYQSDERILRHSMVIVIQ